MEGTGGKAHRFGGDWTSQKLKVLAGYLQSYTTALKNQPFKKAYIDAFAGTGSRAESQESPANLSLFLPGLDQAEPKALLDGSARIALKTDPRFDKYIFIDKKASHCLEPNNLKQEFPEKADDITVRQGDANQEVQALCKKPWSNHRAVLFLDPYGMSVEWTTIEAVARTQAIDLWLLFPLGTGVNRLLKKSGDIPEAWKNRLTTLLGTEKWLEDLLNVKFQQDLFGNEQKLVEKATMDTIGRYFIDRLKEIFPGVAERPGVLKNSVNCPLYLLCFAVGNPRAKDIALGIANHLLRRM